MAFLKSLNYSTVLTLLALFISFVTATPIQNDEHREDAGISSSSIFSLNLLEINARPAATTTPATLSGVPSSSVFTLHLNEVNDQPAATTTPATSSTAFSLNLSEINDRPPGTTTTATDSGVAGFPQHTVHLTPASDSPGPQPSTISLTHSSTSIFPGFPTSIPESEATMIFTTQAVEGAVGVQATTSSACITSITRLPSAVSGPTKIVYASTTTLTVLYPCGTCTMEIVEPTALAPTFTTTLTVQGVSTYATAICTNFPWLDGMKGSHNPTATSASVTSKSHRHTHGLSRVAVRSESEPTSNAEEPMNQEESTSNEEEPACKTTLYVAQPLETGTVKTVWTATKTITDVVHCSGCQLTVINPNGVGPEIFYTSLETVKGNSTTTTRICRPTPAATGYLGPFDLWF